MIVDTDLVSDILARIAEQKVELSDHERRQIEEDVRRDWGGERHYIAKVGECGRQKLSERDARIRHEHRRGEREELLSRRWNISVRRVRQIVRAVEGAVEASQAMAAANDEVPAAPRRRRRAQKGNALP